MVRDLREMIAVASLLASAIFLDRGKLRGMYHCYCADGSQAVVPMPPVGDRNLQITMVRRLFADMNVAAYCYMDEAWTVEGDPAAVREAMVVGASNHPRRIEVLTFVAENELRMLVAQRQIFRDGGLRLGPLVIDDDAVRHEGRTVGLLPVRGTVN